MKKEERKQVLIKKMIEAKKIELGIKEKSFVYKLKSLFLKPKKINEKIKELKEALEKKDVEELEYMILQKESSLLSLKKKAREPKEKEKLDEIIKELNEIKKKESKREKIGREVGFEKKEIKKLKEEIEKKVPEEKKKKKRKKRKRKQKKKKKKTEKKEKTEEEISFISPIKELRKKREIEVEERRKKALEEFHKEFTSGKETLVSIHGNAKIIAGKTEDRGTAYAPVNGRSNEELEFDIQKVKEKIKNLKSAFFHRQINEEDYKKKLFEYQEELHSLEMEKKRPKRINIKQDTAIEDTGLKTVQEESIQFAIKHTPQSRKKVQEALKKFREDFTLQPEGRRDIKSEPPKPTGIIKRLAPEASTRKAQEMEEKIYDLMKRRNIQESDIRKELEFISAQELMKKFDKILNAIEKKYSEREPERIKDTVFEEGTYITKEKKEIKGKIKEIREKKIVTDFDRLLQLVKEKGTVNEKEAAKKLNLTPERIKECYTILEKNDLVKLEFPVFGGVKIIAKNQKTEKKTRGIK
jgi:hypothetical protein